MTRPESPRRPQAGLTLIELLITLVLAAAVTSSAFVFFAGQQRIYETQTQLLNVQQNLWLAMEVLTRQARSAGTAMVGCGPNGLRSFRSGSGVSRLRPLTVTNGGLGGTDEITITSFSNSSGNFWDGTLMEAVPTTYAGTALRSVESELFRDAEFIMLLDRTAAPPGGDRGCSLFRITANPGTSDLIPVASTSTWNSPAIAPGLIPYTYGTATGAIRNLGTLSSMRYFIDSSGGPALAPRLMIDDLGDASPAQILAEGIEDLQLAYACDLEPAGAPDGALTEGTDATARLTDEWFNNQVGDVVDPACVTPASLRITLIARSLTSDTTLFGSAGSGAASGSAKPAVEDGTAGAPDTFRHRVLTTTIYPRNLAAN
jgi:prepilin-type N-terminal cleavage/methylation domain-containing protein